MVPPGGVRGGRPKMRGESTIKPRGVEPALPVTPSKSTAGLAEKAKKRVLFVCIGNSCRSQMAEAFARAYGSDILAPFSAGLAPAGLIAPLTRIMLNDKNIPSDGQFPKGLDAFAGQTFDVVVNVSGQPLDRAMKAVGLPAARVLDWRVRDPIGESETVYRDVTAEIENLVMRLILELRGS